MLGVRLFVQARLRIRDALLLLRDLRRLRHRRRLRHGKGRDGSGRLGARGRGTSQRGSDGLNLLERIENEFPLLVRYAALVNFDGRLVGLPCHADDEAADYGTRRIARFTDIHAGICSGLRLKALREK